MDANLLRPRQPSCPVNPDANYAYERQDKQVRHCLLLRRQLQVPQLEGYCKEESAVPRWAMMISLSLYDLGNAADR